MVTEAQLAPAAAQQADILDYFRAQWAIHATWQERYHSKADAWSNALLVRWLENEYLTEPPRLVTACLVAGGDSPPIALPTQIGPTRIETWAVWKANELRGSDLEDMHPEHYLAMFALDGALHCVVSPGFPLRNDLPDVRALLTHPRDWDAFSLAEPESTEHARALPGPSRASFADLPTLTFPSGMVLPLVWQGVYAASNGQIDKWTPAHEGMPPTYADADGNRMFVHPGDGSTRLTAEQAAAAMDLVLRLDDDVVSAAVISMGKWIADTGGTVAQTAEGLPILPKIRIHVADILRFQGIKQHAKGGYRPEQKQKVARDLRVLNEIWVTGKQEIFTRQGRRMVRKDVNVRSRFMELTQEDDLDLLGNETPYAFRVAPGEWIAPMLGEYYRLMAILLRPVMGYDPRQGMGRVAMRLGLYLAWQWRIRASHGNFEQPWYVRTLLEGACIPIPPKTDRKARQRLIQYFEAALDHMAGTQDPDQPESAERKRVITSWEYQQGEYATLRYHGAFEEWLSWTVRIVPPNEVLQRYARIAPAAARAIAAQRSTKQRRPHPPSGATAAER